MYYRYRIPQQPAHLKRIIISAASCIILGALVAWAYPSRIPATGYETVVPLTYRDPREMIMALTVSPLLRYKGPTQLLIAEEPAFRPEVPSATAFAKRLIFSSAHIASRGELPLYDDGFLYITTYATRAEAERMYAWTMTMRDYGIVPKLVPQGNTAALYLRFLEGAELLEVYRELMDRISGATGLDRSLIQHVIDKESNGDEQAISPAGAGGLVQTLPVVVRELTIAKTNAGTTDAIRRSMDALTVDIHCLTVRMATATDPAVALRARALVLKKYYQRNRLAALSVVPDYVMCPARLAGTCVPLTGQTQRALRIPQPLLPRSDYLALMHGPLNVCFGMAHLALSYHEFLYRRAIGDIDPNTEPLLAAELAYNCGKARVLRQIASSGGWQHMFDMPPYTKASLPAETANYGYQFIYQQITARQASACAYRVHPDRAAHYAMCLMALKRSHDMRSILQALHTTGRNKEREALAAALDRLIDRARTNVVTAHDVAAFLAFLNTLPEWYFVGRVRTFVTMLGASDEQHTCRNSQRCHEYAKNQTHVLMRLPAVNG